jgi:hypothetical protein
MNNVIVGWQGPNSTIPFDIGSDSNKGLNGVYSWQMHYLSPVVL